MGRGKRTTGYSMRAYPVCGLFDNVIVNISEIFRSRQSGIREGWTVREQCEGVGQNIDGSGNFMGATDQQLLFTERAMV